MEGLKIVIQAISVVIAIVIYICIWGWLVINWDAYMRTAYSYPCFERFLSGFYNVWILAHFLLVVFGIVWAWN